MSHRYRFFGEADGEIWRLHESEHRHLKDVLRLPEGTEVEVTDGDGHWIEGRLATISSKTTEVEVVEAHTEAPPLYRLEVAVGALKPGAVDELLPSLVELGIDAVHVILQEGTAKSRLNEKSQERWARITVQAVKQCKRARLPRIVGHESLEAFLTSLGVSLRDRLHGRFLLAPDAPQDLLEATLSADGDCLAVIGGERGFNPAEEKRLESAGFTPVRLGPHVLRAKTAVVAAAALLTTGRDRAERQKTQ